MTAQKQTSSALAQVPSITHIDLADALDACLHTKIAPLVRGTIGIGKSYGFKSFGQKKAKELKRIFVEWNQLSFDQKMNVMDNPKKYYLFGDIRASTCDPTDIKGLPDLFSKENQDGVVMWATSAIFKAFSSSDAAGLLFFDEIMLAPKSIQSALYQVIQDRQAGEHPIGDNVLICAASNLETDKAAIYEMAAPLQNRLAHYKLDIPSFEEWTQWASRNQIDPIIIAFLGSNPELLHTYDPRSASPTFATPRSWEKINNLFQYYLINKKINRGVAAAMASNPLVGVPIGLQFKAYIELQLKLDIAAILANPEVELAKISEHEIDKWWALAAGIASIVPNLKDLQNYSTKTQKQRAKALEKIEQQLHKTIKVIDAMSMEMAIHTLRMVRDRIYSISNNDNEVFKTILLNWIAKSQKLQETLAKLPAILVAT